MIKAKVEQKCFWSRNMELQGLQEALKVEIQCHQVTETSYYYTITGLMNEWELEKIWWDQTWEVSIPR